MIPELRHHTAPLTHELGKTSDLEASLIAKIFRALSVRHLSLKLLAMDQMRLGLDASEECLRGGKLGGPVILTNLRTTNSGAKFLKLAKDNKHLCFFLTGKGCSDRPLSNSLVFETLASARNEVVNRLFAQITAEGVSHADSQDSEQDKVAALGFDDEPAVSPTKSKRHRKIATLLQMPETVAVEFPGSDWTVDVLPESSNKAVHMALTAENMTVLFQLVQHDLASGVVKREKPSGDSEFG